LGREKEGRRERRRIKEERRELKREK